MPTYPTFLIDDLDAELKKQNPALVNFADYTTRRTRAYNRAIADYQESLIQADDLFVRKDTFGTPLSTGATPKVDTSIADIYTIALPADAAKVAGDNIEVNQSTGVILNVPRTPWASIIVISGTGQTLYAWYENSGEVVLCVKDATFTAPAVVNLNYYRRLDATQTAGTVLDIKPKDFSTIVASTLTYILE